MQALGLIETKGLIAATESADAMLKAAAVNLLEKTYVGGGLVSIAITGDVGAVKAAVEAGGAAVRKIDEKLLISQHIIPRPHEELSSIIVAIETEQEETQIEEIVTIETGQEETLIEEIMVIKTEPEVVIVEDSIVKDSKIDESQEETIASIKLDYNKLNNKEAVDKMLLEYGLEETIEALRKVAVAKLRNLAREYKDFGIKTGKISKADKKLLIAEFRKYYENN
ncbi:BMC domain-containing protein [Alkaliphilus sp. MSJ-5]|uniref:BMC domain-containing protein n=1 Tax=Alkaliphilus flagellatus TaxID=2841507 RepID=A0ABS6G0F9_9FIRM|nr:BMC domain-containing protein [Alkaliphilus flagellatus]MBU5675985.1 BMC domain-containing protein [Alkaliphilus flagellatus]